MKKIFLSVLIILVVLIVAAGIAMSLFLGPIAKKGIETIGPRLTGVSVTVDAVQLSLLTGSAGIKNLVVGNPEGYSAPQAIRVGSAAVGINPLSVLSDKIVVRSVRVESPEITFQGNPFSGNNLNAILKNVDAATKSGGPEATNATVKANGKPAKKLEVDDFWITGAKVDFNGMTLPLPDIHLTDLGKDSEGITPSDLTRRVLDALTATTVKTIAGAAANLGKSFAPTGRNVEKSVGSTLSNFSKGLGGLFKK